MHSLPLKEANMNDVSLASFFLFFIIKNIDIFFFILKICSDKDCLSPLSFKLASVLQKSLSILYISLKNTRNYSKLIFSCVWKCNPYLSLMEPHDCSVRTKSVLRDSYLMKPKEDFHQQRTSWCRAELSVSAGPISISSHIHLDEVRGSSN